MRQLPCRGITIKGVTHQIMPLKVIYKATFGEGLAPEESAEEVVTIAELHYIANLLLNFIVL